MTSHRNEPSCQELVEMVTDYLEGALDPAARAHFEKHIAACPGCRIYLEQMRQTIGALASSRQNAVSAQDKERLLRLFRECCDGSSAKGTEKISLGIGDAQAAAGDHIAYFWESEQDFERGVAFLETGLRAGDATFVFGYDEANQKVLGVLKRHGFEIGRLVEAGRLYVLGGGPSGDGMLASIGAAFEKAMAGGARALRLLGNIGWRHTGWPGDDDILEFEARVTAAARNFPCVVVCMYDVRALAGRIILKGGFETHPLTIHGTVLHENPYHVPLEPFLAQLRRESRIGLLQ